MNDRAIHVAPSTVCIGAEISNVDLTQPLSQEQVGVLHDALMKHQVIFFRDQKLDHESHERLGRYFGELILHTGGFGLPDHPEIIAIHGDADSKNVAGESWHSDLSCNVEPPMGSILYMHTLPPVGGDTMFCNMYAVYDALSEPMKAYLAGLSAVHDGEMIYRQYTDDPTRKFPVTAHPVVRTHPVTGRKCLFVNAQYVTHITGVSKLESKAILAYLNELAAQPRFHVRFRWQPHSVAFWDNRCALHQAIWDYYPQTRSGFRVTVKGDRPF